MQPSDPQTQAAIAQAKVAIAIAQAQADMQSQEKLASLATLSTNADALARAAIAQDLLPGIQVQALELVQAKVAIAQVLLLAKEARAGAQTALDEPAQAPRVIAQALLRTRLAKDQFSRHRKALPDNIRDSLDEIVEITILKLSEAMVASIGQTEGEVLAFIESQTQPAVVAASAEAPSSGSKRPAEDSAHSPPAKSRATGKKKPNARTGGRLMVPPAASSEEDANGSSALIQEGVTEEDVALLVGFQHQMQNSSNSVFKKGKEPKNPQKRSAPRP